ncbi:MAG: vitamin K epoxide reductase family protein [Anaerolineae bacterium]|nr:vitamin K epoxide reductase family protein [Anaerolineae bacterium]MDW8299154.1 vitamin K epoxide reductase family protein [Anaerolineae bacterium]
MTTTSSTQEYIAPAASSNAARTKSDSLWRISVILALIGLFIAGYLSYTKLTNTEIACVQAISNCSYVDNSPYAYLGGYGGVPIAYIGFAGYAAIFLTLLGERRLALLARHSKWLIFGMALIGFLVSGYLVAIQALVLHSFCQWCMGSAVTMTVLFGVSFARLWRALSAEPDGEEAEQA